MHPHRRSIALLLGLATCAFVAFSANAQTPPPEIKRIAFQIATGPVAGTFFPVGEALARIVSNPPGFGRCEDDAKVCGPVGLIASARASDGPVANIAAVRSGRVDSALIQGDVASLAFQGEGPFRATGAFKDMRILARLHNEPVELIVSAKAHIRRLVDLKGKRIAIDAPSSATNVTARSILAAAKLPLAKLKISYQPADQAMADLKAGKVDAVFVVGSASAHLADDQLQKGTAKLVPIDGANVAIWLKTQPFVTAADVPDPSGHGTKPVRTVAVAALWVATAKLSDDVAYSLARALWNPANHSELDKLAAFGIAIHRDALLESTPVPLHPGAAKYYQDAGRLQN